MALPTPFVQQPTAAVGGGGYLCGSEYKSRRRPKIAQHHSCYFTGIDVHFFLFSVFFFFFLLFISLIESYCCVALLYFIVCRCGVTDGANDQLDDAWRRLH